jgi:hypothetical protein
VNQVEMQMKKLMIAAGAAALLATSSLSALADEATGLIASINPDAGTVTLDDGQVFKLPTTVALADFKVGQKVKITFTVQQGVVAGTAMSLDTAAGAAPAGAAPAGAGAGPANNPGAPRD